MQKLRKNLPAVISCALLAAISLLNILITVISGIDPTKQITSLLMGLVLILAVSFVKENHIYKAALPIYLCAVAILVIQLVFENHFYWTFNRYICVGAIAFYTASLLPLTSIQIAKSITKYSKVSVGRFIITCTLFLIPVGLVFFQRNLMPVIVSMIVFAIGIVVLKIENRINVPWRALVISVILLGILFVGLYSEGGYFADRINVILTRGACDPFGVGWVRTVLNSIFKSTPLIGATTFTI